MVDASSNSSPPLRAEGRATPVDWLIFVAIFVIGGSSFAMIRGAVETIEPAYVSIGRLWIGAAFLFAVMRAAGRRFPPLLERTDSGVRLSRDWRAMVGLGVVGYAIPFLIFPWAQQYVDSGVAGIYMAFMPIWTVLLAYFFAGESLGRNKLVGFGLGFAGVLILLAPEATQTANTSNLRAHLGLLTATSLYAVYVTFARRLSHIRPRAFAAGTVLSGAVASTPIIFLSEAQFGEWTLSSILNVIALGVGPTGLVGVLLIILVQRVGAGFMAFANYLSPLWAVMLGALLFSERLEAHVFVALAVILAGVAVTQRAPSPKSR